MRFTGSVLHLPVTRCAVRCRGRMAVRRSARTVGVGPGFRCLGARLL